MSPNHTPSHTPRLPFFLPIASPGTPGRASPRTTPGNMTPAAASSFGSRMPNHHLFGANPQPADRRAAAEEELHGSERLAALPPAGHLAASVPMLPIARQSSNRSPELDSELNPELMTDMMDQLTAASAASNSLSVRSLPVASCLRQWSTCDPNLKPKLSSGRDQHDEQQQERPRVAALQVN